MNCDQRGRTLWPNPWRWEEAGYDEQCRDCSIGNEWEKTLPVVDGVHPTAIEELRADAGFHSGDGEQRVNRVLLGDDVHKFDLRGTFALNADPGDFDRRIPVLVSSDLRFDAGEDVILADLLGLNCIVDEEKGQDGILTGFKRVCGVHF